MSDTRTQDRFPEATLRRIIRGLEQRIEALEAEALRRKGGRPKKEEAA